MPELYAAMLNGNAEAADEATRKSSDAGAAALDLASREMMPARDEMGRCFECEQFFIPELLLAASSAEPAGRIELIGRRVKVMVGGAPVTQRFRRSDWRQHLCWWCT
jgi:methanogenic corrinoid protein MtbC1